MRKLFLTILLIACLFAVAFMVVQSVSAVTMAEFRWHAMTLSNIDVTGTAQITTAQVDSFVVNGDKTVATDFALSSYMSSTDTQMVLTTQADPTSRTQTYAMNSNFLPNGLTLVMRKPFGAEGFYRINHTPPLTTTGIPDIKDAPAYAWTEGNLLIIQPAPRVADVFMLAFRSMPTAMTLSTSETGLDESLHRMVTVLAAADICKKLGRVQEEAILRAEYASFKAERLILPKAELEGGTDR